LFDRGGGVDHGGRVVIGLDPRVVVGEDDVDAVPLGERGREPGHGAPVGHVQDRAADLRRTGRGLRPCRLDPLRVPAGR
jgi:hypothetical protein